MLAPSPHPEQPETPDLITEAEAFANLLGDMDVSVAIRFGDHHERIFFDIGADTPSGAVDIMRIVQKRFNDEGAFREAMISAVSSLGYYLADAPSYRADLKEVPAAEVIQALAIAGLLVSRLSHRDARLTPLLSFTPTPGTPIKDNAHLLMKLADDRFRAEPEFARVITDLSGT